MNFERKCAIKLAWFTETGAVTQRVIKGHQIYVLNLNLMCKTDKNARNDIISSVSCNIARQIVQRKPRN